MIDLEIGTFFYTAGKDHYPDKWLLTDKGAMAWDVQFKMRGTHHEIPEGAIVFTTNVVRHPPFDPDPEEVA